ncbi:multidrug effflux MFS transporter [Glutamicibacter sp.]|uniref:multidrug effflux MFS transporter n=1 Tax=Glutamicibacter sp. TaxID=1931995 RepID=UPI0028BE57A7|nr:multidrug effflux MFS transporter [Glutamicibacter sp.]
MPTLSDRPQLTRPLFALLVLLGTTGPLAVDMYLPSFPAMTEEFSSSATGIQLTLTAFLLGLAAGQIFWGALSDRRGRSVPLQWGTAVFVLASVVAALAPTLTTLIIARALQGLGGAAGVVISKAIVADTTRGGQTARIFSLIMTFTGVAPAVAPLLGSVLAALGGFRAVMWFIAIAGVIMASGVFWVYKETLPVDRRSSGSFISPLLQALRRKRFVGYMFQSGFSFGTMMAYVSASPFLYQNVIGLSPQGFALCFGLNSLGLILAGFVSSKLALRVPLRRTVTVALGTLFAAACLMAVLVQLGVRSLVLAVLIFIMVTSLGFTMGNTTALALSEVRTVSGSGSALLGCFQFFIGAVATPLVGLSGEDSPLAFSLTALAAAPIACCALVYTAERFHRKSTAA